ncbi:MAG: transposase [Paraglaciecola sp.]|uniref:transposase n=1 Tax=Paraglaciecola sp. TaxID=1920173 RepID=UPI003267F21A
MSRLPRVCPIGFPQHVIQRGNNRQICFGSEQDFYAYIGWLKTFSSKFGVAVHAWVLMTNHVHLLCTPFKENGISLMMQALGRVYVRYFNRSYRRSGTLWEGRYKSCLVEEEQYFLHLHRYIELNPVRACMVKDPSDYAWSSYQINALGKTSDLCTHHPLYLALGRNDNERQASYREMFTYHLEGELLDEIRKTIHSGMALGNDRFKGELEMLTGRRLNSLPPGRKLGWRKSKT